MSISPPSRGMGLQSFIWLLYYMVLKLQITFIWGTRLPKIHIISKKALNESCSKLNFVQKGLGACMSISNQSGAMTLERSIWLKYNIVLKLQIIFNLGLLPKIRITSKKASMTIVQNWISYRKVRECICLSPHRAKLGASKDWYGCYIIWYWNCTLPSI